MTKLFNLLLFAFVIQDLTDIGQLISGNSEQLIETEVISHCDTEPRSVTIRGYSVRFSEFLNSNGTFDKQCPNNTYFQIIYVYALREVLIDLNLNAPGVEVFVAARFWQVHGYFVIDLKGPEGDFMPKPEVSSKGSQGRGGKAGKPGKPGGNFFGIGEEFFNGDELTISVDGGDGGRGQDGGDAGPGENGRNADKNQLDLYCKLSACNEQGTKTIYTLDNLGEWWEFDCIEEYNYLYIPDINKLRPLIKTERECSYYIYGTEGKFPGSGGNGGVGGEGGLPGNILIYELKERSGILRRSNSSGRNGTIGKGGKGGASASKGLDVSYKRTERYAKSSPRLSGNVTTKYLNKTKVEQPESRNGTDGRNFYGKLEPVEAEKITLRKITKFLAEVEAFNLLHPKNTTSSAE